jgi:glycosyltransferase involved in cell wall biosynthesis
VGAIDHLVGVSRYTARQQELRYGRAVSIVHNGVDIEGFRPMLRDPARRATWGFPADSRILASVGRLVGWKGLRIIISVLPQLAPDVRYLVVGAGPEEANLKAQASALGVADRVHFAGRVAHADLPDVLSEADLYVQPSIGEEAFGISVAEAMACGLPVLASRNGGLPEVVADGETGWLATPGDETAWATALNEALSDRARLRQMGEAARRRVEAQFTWARTSAQLEVLLKGGR